MGCVCMRTHIQGDRDARACFANMGRCPHASREREAGNVCRKRLDDNKRKFRCVVSIGKKRAIIPAIISATEITTVMCRLSSSLLVATMTIPTPDVERTNTMTPPITRKQKRSTPTSVLPDPCSREPSRDTNLRF